MKTFLISVNVSVATYLVLTIPPFVQALAA